MLKRSLKIIVHNWTTLLVKGNARGGIKIGLNLLTNCCNNSGCRNCNELTCSLRTTTTRLIGSAKFHYLAGKLIIGQISWGEKFHELHAVINGHLQLFLISRHIALGTTIYQTYILYTSNTLCRTSHIHSSITSTDNNYVSTKVNGLRCTLKLLEELKSIQSLTGLQGLTTRSPCTNCYYNVGITLRKQSIYICNLNACLKGCTICLAQFDIVIDSFLRNTETRNNVTNNTTKLIGTLKDNYFNTCA